MSEASPRLIFCGDSKLPLESGLLALRELLGDGKGAAVLVPAEPVRTRLSAELAAPIEREIEGIVSLSSIGRQIPSSFERQALFRKVLAGSGEKIAGEIFRSGRASATALSRLYEDLAVLHISAEAVFQKLAHEIRDEASRWEALSRLIADYEAAVSEAGLRELPEIVQSNFRPEVSQIVLFGLCELTPFSQAAIEHWSRQTNGGMSITALVFAAGGEHFDSWGRIVKGAPLQSGRARRAPPPTILSHPREYASAMLTAAPGGGGTVSCGAFQPDEAKYTAALLARKNVKASQTFGTPLASGSFGVFLMQLSIADRSRRLIDLLSLFRIGAVEKFLAAKLDEAGGEGGHQGLLSALDIYRTKFLQISFDQPLVRGSDLALRAIEMCKSEFLTPLRQVTNFAGLCSLLLGWLTRFGAESGEEAPSAPMDQLSQTLERLGKSRVVPAGDPGEMLTWILAALTAAPVASPPEDNLRICSFTDLVFDGRPNACIVGCTDTNLPEPRGGSGFLTEGLRRTLGLPGREEREARDRYFLELIASSRNLFGVYVPQMNLRGDQTFPSKLLFTQEGLAEEIARFYEPASIKKTEGGSGSALVFPSCFQKVERKELSISDLDRYRDSPYKYYLEKVLCLRVEGDERNELDALQFGSFAHEVLEQFAGGAARSSGNPKEIFNFLKRSQQRLAADKFGSNVASAVQTQLVHLEERLRQLAECQATFVSDGWEIWESELDLRGLRVSIPSGTIELFGRVDRIDRRGSSYRVWDYKTAEKAPPKLRRKRAGVDGWGSLQLPLYVSLLKSAGLIDSAATVEVGYISLSSGSIAETRLAVNDALIQEALDEAGTLLERLVQGDFGIGPGEAVRRDHQLACLYEKEYWEEELGEDDVGE